MGEPVDNFLYSRRTAKQTRRGIRAGCRWLAALFLLFFLGPDAVQAGLQIKDNYFWDADRASFFIPRGFAYQVWNPPVYANQTFAELDRDLTAMQQAGANSLRVEFVWEGIEAKEGVYDWSRTDYLVRRAGELGLRLFVLIGYQYPPSWFIAAYPDAMARTSSGPAPILNYNHPRAKEAYARFLGAVCGHYRDSAAIAGWILGNEFAYYDLWQAAEQKNFVGFDSQWSLPAYRNYLSAVYHRQIRELNEAWGTGYADFAAVPMAALYPPDRQDHAAIRRSGYHDLIQWRKGSIADFIAAGAKAAKTAAPDQLISYAMVGGVFSGIDSNITGEDAVTIAERCRAAGAPLDFMSINNYAWALVGHELRSVDFGIAKFRDTLNMPLLISETGHSSTETNFPGAAPRQARALVSSVWESFVSGAAGVFIFHWQDRDEFRSGSFAREAGFGVVDSARRPKPGVYEAITAMFRHMREIEVEKLLPAGQRPAADILVLWPTDIDLGWNRANEELAGLWGALRRLGFRPRIITGETFDHFLAQGFPPAAKALLLPRNFQMRPDQLAALQQGVLGRGLHIHANGDLPGQFDARHIPNPDWPQRMAALFGIETGSAAIALEAGAGPRGPWPAGYAALTLTPTREATLALPPASLSRFATWKLMTVAGGRPGAVVQATYAGGGREGVPALITTSGPRAKTALTTFALGDIIQLPEQSAGQPTPALTWDVRTAWLRTIYQDFFGLQPEVSCTGPGADYVLVDARYQADGVLLALLNEHDQPAAVTVHAPFLSGSRGRDLLTAAPVAISGSNLEQIRLGPDDYRLFFISYP